MTFTPLRLKAAIAALTSPPAYLGAETRADGNPACAETGRPAKPAAAAGLTTFTPSPPKPTGGTDDD